MSMEKTNKREKQKAATKIALFKAATALIKKNGFDKVSVRDIANAADVTTGAFYVHFRSKEDIVSQVFYENLNDYIMHSISSLDQERLDPADHLIAILIAEFKFANTIGVELTTLAYITNFTANMTIPGSHFKKRRFVTSIQQDIEQLEGQKRLLIQPANEVLFDLSSMIRGIMATWCFANGDFDIVDHGTITINRLIKTLIRK